MIIRAEDEYSRNTYFPGQNQNLKDLDLLLRGKDRLSQHYRRKQLLQSMLSASTSLKGKILSGHTDRIIYIDPVPQNNIFFVKPDASQTSAIRREEKSESCYLRKIIYNSEDEEVIVKNTVLKKGRRKVLPFRYTEVKEKSTPNNTLSLYFNQNIQPLPQIKTERLVRKVSSTKRPQRTFVIRQTKEEHSSILVDPKIVIKYEKKAPQEKQTPSSGKYEAIPEQKDLPRPQELPRPQTKKSKLYNQVVQTFNINDLQYEEVDQQGLTDFQNYVTHQSQLQPSDQS